jgi:Cys-tRNA(Pro)/Cys-tRNA(Cys) deacylase
LAATGTPATVALTKAGLAFSVHEFDHDGAAGRYGKAAAVALGVDEARVFKTLLAVVDGTPAVAIVPVATSLQLKALAAALGGKRAEMMDPAAAQRRTGMVVGGISPFGQKQRSRTVLDESALAHPTIFVSGGRRGLDVQIAPADLVTLLDATVAPLTP